MNWDAWLPVLVVASSLLPGLVIFFLREGSHHLRTLLNLAGAIFKLVLVGILIWGVFHEHVYETRWTLAPGLDLVLHADSLSILFVTLSTVLWLVTTVYAIGYLENAPHRSRFFGFFSLCVSATVGLALAGNLFTFVLFYELLTLATYQLSIPCPGVPCMVYPSLPSCSFGPIRASSSGRSCSGLPGPCGLV